MRRIPNARSHQVAGVLRRCLKLAGRKVSEFGDVLLAGSARRGRALSKDVDILIVLPARLRGRPGLLAGLECSASRSLKFGREVQSGARRRSVDFELADGGHIRRHRLDLFLAFADEMPFALFHHTGSHNYNIRVRAHAKARGWLLNQYGLFDRTTRRPVAGSKRLRDEAALARFLGLSVRAPAERE